jgi:nucleotide-binding universal stress UspA family protein
VLSAAAAAATAFALDLAVVRVLDPYTDLGAQPSATRSEAAEAVAARWLDELSRTLDEAGMRGAPCVVHRARAEDIHDTLLRAAAERKTTMFAMDSRGHGLLRRALLGSVLLGVIGKTDLPVLVTGEAFVPRPPHDPYHVLLTSDGSAASVVIVDALAPILRLESCRVTLTRILEDDAPGAREDAEQQLELLRRRLPGALDVALTVRPAGLVGVADAIVAAARDEEADAIAMATHGRSALRQAVAGSVTLGVLGRSPLPVIVARSPA